MMTPRSIVLPARLAIVLLTLFAALDADAQPEKQQWIFGYNSHLDFSTTPPTARPGAALNSYEASASIADRVTGELLFSTDGVTVWNRQHQPMPNGRGLAGDLSSTQGALIVPMPGSTTHYYVFTADAVENEYEKGLQYSIVDMTLDGGLGDVVVKNTMLHRSAGEKVIAISRCSDDFFWVISHEFSTDVFLAYLVSSTGIAPPVLSRVGTPLDSAREGSGYLRASPDGRRLAIALPLRRTVEVFDFDGATGAVSNPISLSVAGTAQSLFHAYGVEFSPNSRKLFANEGIHLYQFDLSAGDAAAIQASRVLIDDFVSYVPTAESLGALALGPDDQLYIVAAFTGTLIVLDDPNATGSATWGGRGRVTVSGSLAWGLPNFLVDPPPIALSPIVSNDTSLCEATALQLSASGGQTYEWTPSEGLSCTDCPNPVARPTRSMTYYVTITSGACAARDSVHITIGSRMRVIGDSAVCPGALTRLSVDGAPVRWRRDDGMVLCESCTEIMIQPTVTTTYILESPTGCPRIDSFTVRVIPPPAIAVSGGGGICPGASTQLRASGATTYRWEPSAGLSCTDCADPVASPTSTTYYRVIGANDAGCTDTATVEVAVLTTVRLAGDSAVCSGGTARLSVSGPAVRWRSAADGVICASCREITVRPTTTTTYYIDAPSGCPALDSFTVRVTAAPVVSVSGGGGLCRQHVMQLGASGASSYRWEPAAGLSCVDCPNPIASPAVTTRYRVIGTNPGGCADTSYVDVTVVDSLFVDARLDRGVVVRPGVRSLVAARLTNAIVTDSITARVGWNPELVLTDAPFISARLVSAGWRLEILDRGASHVTVLLWHAGSARVDSGEIFVVPTAMYLGDSTASELSLTATAEIGDCYRLRSAPGQIELDSLCGLRIRMSEFSPMLLRLAPPAPNPTTGDATVRFGLAFDAHVDLSVVDLIGVTVRTLVAGMRAAGDHEVGTGELPSGTYFLVMRVDEAVLVERFVVAE